jgi:hypothetical protein
MPCRWRELVLAATIVPCSLPAQQVAELGVQGIITFSDPVLGVTAGYGALRLSERTRLSGSLGAGLSAGELAWRGEFLGHFLLSPDQLRKPGLYLAGGVAGAGRDGGQGYLVLTLGAEARPRAGSGWAVELGVGGGLRLAAGYRWRHRSSPGKQ